MNALVTQRIVLQLARIVLPCTATVAALCLAGALAAFLVYPAYAQDPPSCPNPTPTAVAVTAVPIVVASTTADYFVLFVRPDLNADLKIPISVTLGVEGATTLTEQLSPLPKEHYMVEKYSVDDPADVDRDCISDIEELADLGTLNPINQLPKIGFRHGTVAIPDRETFERLSYKGPDVLIDDHLTNLEFVKFFIIHRNSSWPAVYFMNTVTHRAHYRFSLAVRHPRDGMMKGEIVYHPDVEAPDGSLGVYRFEFEPQDAYPFEAVRYAYEVLAASMPLLENNLAYYPMPAAALPLYEEERTSYDDSRINVIFEADIFPDADFLSLNQGTGYGYLRVMGQDERPNPRDIVIYESLPNDLPRVAGIITTVAQTPLSHVNLRALQDRVPNAFVRDALDDTTIDSLIDSHVRYTVTRSGYTIGAAARAEVDAHYDASRPAATQTPERDLSVTAITPLSGIEFADWTAFGVKAANVAVLGTLGFPDGTVPDGFAVPFYFYDEFMKANELDTMVSTMLANSAFQTSYDTQEKELKKLRNAIKDATTPDSIITALEEMHGEFPDGTSLRYRSSTNNEDLPGFSGAGLYDSKTQDPEETEEDGIDKSIKGVWASLWNFRAFVERDFHRVDHLTTAMGVLVHPNYSDELANGVAVSYDPINAREGVYYVNTQIGEDLVTNPDANSVPEELLLLKENSYEVLVYSNQVESEQLLMSDTQIEQLRGHLATIHDKFDELYDPDDGKRFAMEIEFKITSEDVLAIKQARPWVFRPLNEPPEFPSTETGVRQVAEGTAPGTEIGAPVAATDAEGDVLTYSLSGPDASSFLVRPATGALLAWADLDYETQATYSVTVEVLDRRDSAGRISASADAMLMVSIMLTNEEEFGALTLSPEQTQVGTQLTATLTDPDGGISGQSWSWERSQNGSDWSPIANAAEGRYTPVQADLNHYLRVTVQYSDGHGSGKRLQQVSNHRTVTRSFNNQPPAFDNSKFERSVPENSTADTTVGIAVVASDPENETLSYRLSGDNNFTIDSATGQIRVASGAALDHERRPTHTVVVTASDPSNAYATATGTISVGDVNEPPVFDMATISLEVVEDAEEGASVGRPVAATDDDGDQLSYSLSGRGPFAIDETTGQIVVGANAVLDPSFQDTYSVTVEARDPNFARDTIDVTIKVVERIIRTTTILSTGGSRGGPSGPTPSEVDFEWNVTRDIEELDGGNDRATGVWSDGTTLWVADNADGAGDTVYAYDRESGKRVEEREFELHETNRAPRGFWSDRETVWVSDSGRERLFAYRLTDGERLEEREFALAAGNSDARGIWSDEETMWVLDGRDALFAYDFGSGDLLGEYALDDANSDPHGIWSDGVTVWVSDHGAKRLFAYRLPVLPDAEADSGEEEADDDDRELERVRDEEFPSTVLSRASNNSPRGLWSDGDVMYVADESDDRVYSYNMPDAIDARLASLTLSGVDIGEFSPGRTEYEAVVADGVTETAVEAEALQRRTTVVIDPTDADGDDANGHQVVLRDLGEITVTVTSQDGSRSKTYRVRFPETGWDPARDPWPHCLRGAVSEGLSLVVYEGGSVEELISCAESRGIVSLYALHEGVYLSYILGAPGFVNQPFVETFAGGLPPITPLVAGSNGPPSADPFGDDLEGDGRQPWPECLRGPVAAGLSLVVYEGGSGDALVVCARSMGITALYALHEGVYLSYILGAPDFVNRAFRDLFADGLPLMTPLVARSEGPPGGR